MRDIDQIESTLVVLYPELKGTQLKVLHPGADDDSLWFFSHPACRCEAQLEAPTAVDQAVEGVAAKLGLPAARRTSASGR